MHLIVLASLVVDFSAVVLGAWLRFEIVELEECMWALNSIVWRKGNVWAVGSEVGG